MRITGTGIGAVISLLVMLLFSGLRAVGRRKGNNAGFSTGEIPDAIGFGLLPGIAVWKIFEQGTLLGKGIGIFDPVGEIPLITEGGRFAVSRAEMILAAVCFAAVILWLILRKEDLPGNGDLLLTVLCVWGLIRAFTEGFREETILRAGRFNMTQILLLAAADMPLAVWTVRLDAAQKSTAFSILEWIAVLSCETVMVLNTSEYLSAGSRIGDLAVKTGSALLALILTLLVGGEVRKLIQREEGEKPIQN